MEYRDEISSCRIFAVSIIKKKFQARNRAGSSSQRVEESVRTHTSISVPFWRFSLFFLYIYLYINFSLISIGDSSLMSFQWKLVSLKSDWTRYGRPSNTSLSAPTYTHLNHSKYSAFFFLRIDTVYALTTDYESSTLIRTYYIIRCIERTTSALQEVLLRWISKTTFHQCIRNSFLHFSNNIFQLHNFLRSKFLSIEESSIQSWKIEIEGPDSMTPYFYLLNGFRQWKLFKQVFNFISKYISYRKFHSAPFVSE